MKRKQDSLRELVQILKEYDDQLKKQGFTPNEAERSLALSAIKEARQAGNTDIIISGNDFLNSFCENRIEIMSLSEISLEDEIIYENSINSMCDYYNKKRCL